jgi:hypothetical protein
MRSATRAKQYHSIDALVACVLAIFGAVAIWRLTALLNHIPALAQVQADDVWFEGDVKRVFDNMTDRWSAHYRTSVHPLFSLFGLICTQSLRHFFKVTPLVAVRITLAAAAAAWLIVFYCTLRILRCRVLDAAIFTLLAASSSAALFWATVPETYLFGSLTIILALLLAALSERRTIPVWLDVAAGVTALSMLVTNWMYPLASMWTRRRLVDVIQLASNSFVIVVLLWAVEKFVAPSAQFFLGYHEKLPVPLTREVFPIFFLDSMVMPDVLIVANDTPDLWPKFSVQGALSWHLTPAGPVALGIWVVLLAAGLWALLTVTSLKRFRTVLALTLAGQLALHLLYGNETFLYVLDFMPTLVLMAALATFTRLRWAVLAAAVLATFTCAYHNYAELMNTLQILATRTA